MFHWFKRHTKEGLERPDSTPHEITLREDFKRPLTIAEQIARFTRAADFEKAVAAHGLDSFDEADDLEVEDETDELFGRSAYETREDFLDGVQTRLDELRGGQVREIDPDRVEKAQERLRTLKEASRAAGRPKPAPEQPAREEGAGRSIGKAGNLPPRENNLPD